MFSTWDLDTPAHPLAQAFDLLDVDLAGCDTDTLRTHVAVVHAAQAVLHALLIRIADHARHLETSGTGAPAEETLLGAGAVPAHVARRHTARSALADQFPAVASAIRSGSARPASIDALTAVWQRLDPDEQARFADTFGSDIANELASVPTDTFGQLVRRRARSIRGDDGLKDHDAQVAASNLRIQRCRNGMRRITLELDALRGDELAADIDAKARSLAAINARIDHDVATAAGRPGPDDTAPDDTEAGDAAADGSVRRRHPINARLRADALHLLARAGALPTNSGVPRSTRLTILCDQHTAQNGPHDHTVSETLEGDPVPHSILHHHACDAVIQPLLIGPDGQPFDAGRTTRTATTRQKHALRALYDTCPLSGTPFRDCEIHHVQYWEHDGPTNLANLLPLAPRWHHLIHDHHWRLVLHLDRSIDLYRPDNTLHRHISPPIPMTRRSLRPYTAAAAA